jgi:phosphate transport system permease protein
VGGALTASADSATLRQELRGRPSRHRREKLVQVAFFAAAVVSILISVFIVYSLIFQAISFLSQIDLSQLKADGWFPRRGMFDLATLIAGTLLVTVIAMLIATPVGLASAIYLSEYAKPRTRRIIKPILEVLAGIPSVVIGYFALAWINPNVIKAIVSNAEGYTVAAAGIGVGILIIPLIASIAEDAMRAVPNSLREASYGLGARRITTSLRVVFPAAVSGIVAALILGVSRAIGETMVVALAAGGSGNSLFSLDPFASGQTLTAAMAALATGSEQVAGATAAFQSLFFVGLVLFVITLLLNVIGDAFVRRTRQSY